MVHGVRGGSSIGGVVVRVGEWYEQQQHHRVGMKNLAAFLFRSGYKKRVVDMDKGAKTCFACITADERNATRYYTTLHQRWNVKSSTAQHGTARHGMDGMLSAGRKNHPPSDGYALWVGCILAFACLSVCLFYGFVSFNGVMIFFLYLFFSF
ncbi:hypothetical protein M426DRAFT_183923 [Hypoxylon sp. CI-4A]|nr:hypothetical protein M426DRAFT_183923 [Hypoxylon sp. CI-4A]